MKLKPNVWRMPDLLLELRRGGVELSKSAANARMRKMLRREPKTIESPADAKAVGYTHAQAQRFAKLCGYEGELPRARWTIADVADLVRRKHPHASRWALQKIANRLFPTGHDENLFTEPEVLEIVGAYVPRAGSKPQPKAAKRLTKRDA